MKKVIVNLILIICFVATCFVVPNIAKADTFNNNTLVYTHYNTLAEYYDNLDNISSFDVSAKYIAYTLDNSHVIIINKATKQANIFGSNIICSNITDLTLTKNFLFISDDNGLKAYNVVTASPKALVINSSLTALPKYKAYSIFESGDNIIIACINDNYFCAYTYSSSDLSLTHTYVNTAVNNQDFQNCTLLKVVTTSTSAYILNSKTMNDSNNLWKINYSNTSSFQSSLFPKSNITSLITYTHTTQDSNTDYLIAIGGNTSIYVIRTDLQYDENDQGKDLTDQTRDGNTTDSRYIVNDISKPCDITTHNGVIYIADRGTKCIQEFNFELTTDSKGSIKGTKILVAGACGEVGRFNTNSNIDFSNSNIIVADSTNRRIQILDDVNSTNLDLKTFTSTTANDLNNLNTAHIVDNKIFFTSYNEANNQQNIFEYNTSSSALTLKPHSIARIYDSTMIGNNIYYISANGLYALNTISGSITNLNSTVFTPLSRISSSDNLLFIANEQSINIISLTGIKLNSINLTETVKDLVWDVNSLYLLDTENIIHKYNILSNNIEIVTSLDLGYTESSFYSITIDNSTGILYLFDNVDCKIVKLINPTFNYKACRGVFQVNNKKVSVYDQPYFLNGIDNPNVLSTLDVNTRVNIYSTTPLHYGNIEYYIIELSNNQFGYINRNDLTYLSQETNFEVIYPNATLRSFDSTNKINIYSAHDSASEIIATADNGTRVYIVETADDYTLVKYYDNDQTIVQGYVITNQVNPDNMTNNQITALILVGCSIVLLVGIIIVVAIVYKKRKRQSM